MEWAKLQIVCVWLQSSMLQKYVVKLLARYEKAQVD